MSRRIVVILVQLYECGRLQASRAAFRLRTRWKESKRFRGTPHGVAMIIVYLGRSISPQPIAVRLLNLSSTTKFNCRPAIHRAVTSLSTMQGGIRRVGGAQIPWTTQPGYNGTCVAKDHRNSTAMLVLSLLFSTLLSEVCPQTVPEQAQFVDQKSFNDLKTVPPPSESNLTTVSMAFRTSSPGIDANV